MKKMIALLLAAAFILSCVPAMALDKKVTSDLLGTSVFVPENLELLAEFSSDDTDDIYMFFLMNDFSNLQINSSLLYKPEYLGMQTKDVPKEDIESWKEFFNRREGRSLCMHQLRNGSVWFQKKRNADDF